MKITTCLLSAVLAAWLLLTLSTATASSSGLGPVWAGPRQSVHWLGLSAIIPDSTSTTTLVTLGKTSGATSSAANPSADEAAVADAKLGVPKWVGYNKRGIEWWFRVQLASQKTEMIHRAGTTSDGWVLAGFQAQANRPTSITLEKNGVSRTLTLTRSEAPTLPGKTGMGAQTGLRNQSVDKTKATKY